jgi:hypothetical protein
MRREVKEEGGERREKGREGDKEMTKEGMKPE